MQDSSQGCVLREDFDWSTNCTGGSAPDCGVGSQVLTHGFFSEWNVAAMIWDLWDGATHPGGSMMPPVCDSATDTTESATSFDDDGQDSIELTFQKIVQPILDNPGQWPFGFVGQGGNLLNHVMDYFAYLRDNLPSTLATLSQGTAQRALKNVFVLDGIKNLSEAVTGGNLTRKNLEADLPNTDLLGYTREVTIDSFKPSSSTDWKSKSVDGGARAASVYVEAGGTFLLGNGKLVVNTGSHLIIERGATLEIDEGAEIELRGNSSIEIHGDLVIRAKAQFAYQGDGYVLFDLPDAGGLPNLTMEAGSSIWLWENLFIVTPETYVKVTEDPTTAVTMQFSTGALGAGSYFDVSKATLILDYATITSTGGLHNGLVVNGYTTQISNSNFRGGNPCIRALPQGGAALNVTTSEFAAGTSRGLDRGGEGALRKLAGENPGAPRDDLGLLRSVPAEDLADVGIPH